MYAGSALAALSIIAAFAKTYGVRTVAIRFGNVYGPWCARKRGVLNVFFESLHSGVPLVIYGDGSSARDYVHVDDISSALQLGLEKDVPGGTVLHAASGVETTAKELADLCRQAAGLPGHPVEYRPKRAGEVGRNFASYDLAHQVLPHGLDLHPPAGVRGGELPGQLGRQRRHRELRPLMRRSAMQAADHVERVKLPPRQFVGIEGERRPQPALVREVEAGRHHADHSPPVAPRPHPGRVQRRLSRGRGR